MTCGPFPIEKLQLIEHMLVVKNDVVCYSLWKPVKQLFQAVLQSKVRKP